jgi:hypothetical protein
MRVGQLEIVYLGRWEGDFDKNAHFFSRIWRFSEIVKNGCKIGFHENSSFCTNPVTGAFHADIAINSADHNQVVLCAKSPFAMASVRPTNGGKNGHAPGDERQEHREETASKYQSMRCEHMKAAVQCGRMYDAQRFAHPRSFRILDQCGNQGRKKLYIGPHENGRSSCTAQRHEESALQLKRSRIGADTVTIQAAV